MQTKPWIFLLMLFVLLGVFLSNCNKVMAESKKKFYEIEFLDKNNIKLTSHIHLIPPGSQLLHENVRLKDIGDLPIKADLKADLKKDAMLSIVFFEKKLKEEVGKNSHLKFEKALFNVYMDFMGKHTTDMIYMIYKIRGE
jgi:hypothetical protein